MAGFSDSLKLNTSKVLEEIKVNCYKIMDDLFIKVVYKTPVLTGALKNNWFTAVGGNFSNATTSTTDPNGNDSLLSIQVLKDADLFQGKDSIASMSNNLTYAANAEYIGWPKPGWSGRVGPYAMVRNSLTEISAKYQ
jgi:hypothetical protein